MNVTKIKENTYFIDDNGCYYTLEFKVLGEEILINIQEQNTPSLFSYSGSITMNSLYQQNKMLKNLSIQQTFHILENQLNQSKIKILKQKNETVLFFKINDVEIKFIANISQIQKVNITNINKLISETKVKYSFYENEIEKLTKYFTDFKKSYLSLVAENEYFQNGSSIEKLNHLLLLQKSTEENVKKLDDYFNWKKIFQKKVFEEQRKYFIENNRISNSKNNSLNISNILNIENVKYSDLLDLTKIKLIKTINAHSSYVFSICLLKDNRLASCSGDSTIKIFNLKDFKCDLTLFGHTNNVLYIDEIEDSILGSCSDDKTVRIWKIEGKSYKCLQKMNYHKNSVFKIIKLSNGRFGTCSADQIINIYKAQYPFELEISLKGHTSYVFNIIELKNNYFIVSGSGYQDGTIRFWNSISYKCEKIIPGIFCSSRNSLIEVENDKLIVGGYNSINVVNCIEMKLEKQISFSNTTFWSLLENKNGTVLCGVQKKIFIIDSNTFKIIGQKMSVHKEEVYSLLFLNHEQLVTCSGDFTIKIWKLN